MFDFRFGFEVLGFWGFVFGVLRLGFLLGLRVGGSEFWVSGLALRV